MEAFRETEIWCSTPDFQGILSWESIRLSWRIMPVSVERPPFFLRFSPAFPPLPCASRKGGRAAARRPLYLHNSSVNRANSCKFNASPRIVSGSRAVIAASILLFRKMRSLRIFQSVRQRLPSLIKRRPNNGEHQLLILRLHRHHLMTRQPDHRTSNLRPRHKTVRRHIRHNIRLRIILHRQRQRPRNPSIPAPSASGPQPPSEP